MSAARPVVGPSCWGSHPENGRDGAIRRPAQFASPGNAASVRLSVVIPVRNERDNLRLVHEQLRQAQARLELEYEVVCLDVGVPRDYTARPA